MKINTKQCSPIKGSPEETMIHPNKYILGDDKQQYPTKESYPATTTKGAAKSEIKDDGGRELKYLPKIVYTPILTSKRHGNDEKRRLFSPNDVEELNKKLEELFLDDKEEEKEEETDTEINSPTKKVDGELSLFGRVFRTFISYKTCKFSVVLKSARFIPKVEKSIAA